tara:strand:+ start:589 stop:882 length:294 start_codon:yes stop_codon:yes gene_type:complete
MMGPPIIKILALFCLAERNRAILRDIRQWAAERMILKLPNQLPRSFVKIVNSEFQEKFNAANKHRGVDFSSDEKSNACGGKRCRNSPGKRFCKAANF